MAAGQCLCAHTGHIDRSCRFKLTTSGLAVIGWSVTLAPVGQSGRCDQHRPFDGRWLARPRHPRDQVFDQAQALDARQQVLLAIQRPAAAEHRGQRGQAIRRAAFSHRLGRYSP